MVICFGGAKDNSIIKMNQNNAINAKELDKDTLNKIIEGITNNLSCLNKEDANGVRDIVDMTKEELSKPEPKVSRLRNCLTLIAPMFTIANGIPTLTNNL